jgi:KAP family P-loop domain/Caspase domain
MRDWPPLHDYGRSRAVVMGAWSYTHLAPIAAAANSLDRMAGLLTSPLCGWPRDRVQILADVPSPGDLPYRLVTTFENISDVALFYYVGHGQIDAEGELCLGLTETRPEVNLRAVTSLPFQLVRQAMQGSDAAVKIVILDCCFSGLATRPLNILSGAAEEVADLATGTGAHTMAASGRFGAAWFESASGSERPQTIFTKYLVDLVESGIPGGGSLLPLGRLFEQLRDNLARDRRPVPQQRSTDAGRDFAFAHNVAANVPPADTVSRSNVTFPAAGRSLADVYSDAPSETDMVGVATDVAILADLIAATDTSPPLAIALIGEWGAGKSSAILQIRRQVDRLAADSRRRPGLSPFASNVRQVTFNAWDYSDDQVWCGIIEQLFETLAVGPVSATSDPEKVQDNPADLRQEIAELETAGKRLSDALRTADRFAGPPGLLAGLRSPAYAWQIVTAACRELTLDIRSAVAALAFWLILGAAASAIWWRWGPVIGSAAAIAGAVIAPVAVLVQQAWRGRQAGGGIIARLRRRLSSRQHTLSQQIADRRQRLALVDAGARLSAFLTDRNALGAYREHRGLVGQVRRDLARLSEDLASARQEWMEAGSAAPPPLERIVLYVDDLDRCPPRRVVEVLEAVHLMLALELFVVVVAFDSRWLVRSLELHYRELFSAGSTQPGVPGLADPGNYSPDASPIDYLDKIFQVPYVIRRPAPAALGRYLRSMLPSPNPAAAAADIPEDGSGLAAGRISDSADLGKVSGESRHASEQERDAGAGQPDPSPQRLNISQHEIEFISQLGPLLPTPRAAKRLANLYRLVRVSIPQDDLASFTGSDAGGPYQAVQILLAVLVGWPAIARLLFTEIMRAPADADIFQVLNRVVSASSLEARLRAKISTDFENVTQQLPWRGQIDEYRRWCPVLARYSFHTCAMIH